MSARHEIPHDRGDAAFDQAARDLHQASLAHLQPATATRLRAARRAGGRTATHGIRHWGLAGVAAAVCALAVGWLALPTAPDAPPQTTAGAPMPDNALATALADAEAEAALVPFDEDPDFYLWLAANDDVRPSILER
ncbi:hypothetical protein H4F99_08050 [Lysobacter sp. SG-8]|uniref:DUF3619 family protein n=1 Tax=Marilutibacter penaei TaxID=2759900 RepID=A0A7W3YEQ4_9GAMM|nr:hypothetical protein [Lysobacter penaei]MBB1088441.1 hypothetical protein [Lysobacter penaei]